jgi:hypothetical protein
MKYNEEKVKSLLVEVDQKSHINTIVKGFISPFIGVKRTRFIVSCAIHGSGEDWGNKWQPTGDTLLNSKAGCPKCVNRYSDTAEEALFNINKTTSSDVMVHGFIGEYIGTKSKCVVSCKHHGSGNDYEKKWQPILKELKRQKIINCPKCFNFENFENAGKKESVKETKEEALFNINEKTSTNIIVHGVVGKYKGAKTRCIVSCKHHGSGLVWDNKWIPTIKKLKEGLGCPKCAFESRMLSTLLKKTELMGNSRNIYFAKFKSKNIDIFYKIGVCKHGINTRYSNSLLKKDNLELCDFEIIKTNSLFALIVEYWCLKEFKDYRVDMYHRMKHSHGGGECFSEDITKKMALKDMVSFALNCFDSVLNDFVLTSIEKSNAKNKFNKLFENSIFVEQSITV